MWLFDGIIRNGIRLTTTRMNVERTHLGLIKRPGPAPAKDSELVP